MAKLAITVETKEETDVMPLVARVLGAVHESAHPDSVWDIAADVRLNIGKEET